MVPGLWEGFASFCEIAHLIQFVPSTQLSCEGRHEIKSSSDEMNERQDFSLTATPALRESRHEAHENVFRNVSPFFNLRSNTEIAASVIVF